MAIKQSRNKTIFLTIVAWAIGIIMFFPIFWTAVAAFKTESDAYSLPQNWLSTPWTLENFAIVQERSDYIRYIFNTTVIVVLSTLLGLVFAIPAAWSMAFAPNPEPRKPTNAKTWLTMIFGALVICFLGLYFTDWKPVNFFVGLALLLIFVVPASLWAWNQNTSGTLLWMLSTKMMPPAGALIPIYLIFNRNGLIFKDWGWINLSHFTLMDSFWGMVPLMTLLNLPIIIWMLFTYFKEIPVGILEAARMDGASLWNELYRVLTPMALPGIASTCLLNLILSWNEAFWSLNLTNKFAAPLSFFISEYSSPEGQFWAKLSAASIMAIAPILVVGWFSQKQLVRGLTFGAVK
ncbi:MAG: carbohydrate ABC transporter permease [Alphaproteobacteria bacterium]|nr:carbohydrate ABC transporter permease [Alphaproteobacteria bacterium]